MASDFTDDLVFDKDFTVFPLMADFILAQRFVDAEKNSEEIQKMKQHQYSFLLHTIELNLMNVRNKEYNELVDSML